MWKNRREIAKLFFIIFALSLIILSIMTIGHIEHNCIGEDCTICYEINLMKSIFKNLLILSLLFAFINNFEKYAVINNFFSKKYYLTKILLTVRLIE